MKCYVSESITASRENMTGSTIMGKPVMARTGPFYLPASWYLLSFLGHTSPIHSSASSVLSSLAPRMLGRPESQWVKSNFNGQWSCSRTCLIGSGGSPYPQRRLRQQWWEKIWGLKPGDKGDFPGGPVAKTPCSHYWGLGFHPKSGK